LVTGCLWPVKQWSQHQFPGRAGTPGSSLNVLLRRLSMENTFGYLFPF
jgi:hypothetical protein